MEEATIIMLLTINLIVLSVVIITLIIIAIMLAVKLNRIAHNVKETTANVASITNWFSPVKVFQELAQAIKALKKK